MSGLGDLINKSKEVKAAPQQTAQPVQTEKKKTMLLLKKATADAKPAQTRATGTAALKKALKPQTNKPLDKALSFLMKDVKDTSAAVASSASGKPSGVSGGAAKGLIPPCEPDAAPPIDLTMTDAELSEADIIHASQLEGFDQDALDEYQTNLSILRESLGDQELVGQAIANLLQSMQQHSFLAKVLRPQDGGVMIRALRESYGVVIAKKSERSTKKAEKSKKIDDIASELGLKL